MSHDGIVRQRRALLRHRPGTLAHEPAPWELVWDQIGAKGSTFKEMAASPLPLMKEKPSLASLVKVIMSGAACGKGGKSLLHLQPYVPCTAMCCLFPSFLDYYLKSFIITVFKAN